jgi:hypothetical protein
VQGLVLSSEFCLCQALARADWDEFELDEMIDECHQVFHLIVALPANDAGANMLKAGLVEAQGGDLYEQIDNLGIGHITLDNWIEFFSRRHSAKEARGVGQGARWLRSHIRTLCRGCQSGVELQADENAHAIRVEKLMAEAEEVFHQLRGEEEGVTSSTLATAYPEDKALFDYIHEGHVIMNFFILKN